MDYNKVINTDVIVFGAGPAGISASISAAREGLDVHLIEVQGKIGGVMSFSPGMMLGGGYPCGKSVGGFFEELVQELYNMKPPAAEKRSTSIDNFGEEVVYNHEYTIATLYEKLDEAGIHLHINAVPTNVNMNENEITSVDIADVAGISQYVAKQYIDCTGNGDIGNKAGVPSQVGDEQGKMMGGTLTFFMENVDWGVVFDNELNTDPYFTEFAKKGIEMGQLHKTTPQIYMVKGLTEGTVFFNTITVPGVDGRDPSSVIEMTNIARKRVIALAEFCIEHIPGFENANISYIGPQVGIRETRKLEGIHLLTSLDIAKGTKFEDGVVASDNPADLVFRDEDNPYYDHPQALEKGDYYTIPFRSFVPKVVKNLLFGGRCISAEPIAFASVRGMPTSMIMGQSLGIGASVAIDDSIPVQEIDTDKVVEKLKENNVKGIGGSEL